MPLECFNEVFVELLFRRLQPCEGRAPFFFLLLLDLVKRLGEYSDALCSLVSELTPGLLFGDGAERLAFLLLRLAWEWLLELLNERLELSCFFEVHSPEFPELRDVGSSLSE